SSPATLRVGATFDPLACYAPSALLGSAGPTEVFHDFSGAQVPGTWYAKALANAQHGSELDAVNVDITAQFNSSIGTSCPFPNTWFYGLDGSPPVGQIDLVSVLVHELGHGLSDRRRSGVGFKASGSQ